jgi:hypothetical protein
VGAEAAAIVSDPANTPEPRVESDGYARKRYRGSGRRGSPTVEARHAVDVRIARSELEGALAMLADGPAIADPRARRENRRAAVAKIALAARALDDVLARDGIAPPDCTPNRPIARRGAASTP